MIWADPHLPANLNKRLCIVPYRTIRFCIVTVHKRTCQQSFKPLYILIVLIFQWFKLEYRCFAQKISRIQIILYQCRGCCYPAAAVKAVPCILFSIICRTFQRFPRNNRIFTDQILSDRTFRCHNIIPCQICLDSFKCPLRVRRMQLSERLLVAFRKSLRGQIAFKFRIRQWCNRWLIRTVCIRLLCPRLRRIRRLLLLCLIDLQQITSDITCLFLSAVFKRNLIPYIAIWSLFTAFYRYIRIFHQLADYSSGYRFFTDSDIIPLDRTGFLCCCRLICCACVVILCISRICLIRCILLYILCNTGHIQYSRGTVRLRCCSLVCRCLIRCYRILFIVYIIRYYVSGIIRPVLCKCNLIPLFSCAVLFWSGHTELISRCNSRNFFGSCACTFSHIHTRSCYGSCSFCHDRHCQKCHGKCRHTQKSSHFSALFSLYTVSYHRLIPLSVKKHVKFAKYLFFIILSTSIIVNQNIVDKFWIFA